MAYTPELTQTYSGTLRRIAWAFEVPMSRAIEGIFDCVTKCIDPKRICEACRDKSFCKQCLFNNHEKTTGSKTKPPQRGEVASIM